MTTQAKPKCAMHADCTKPIAYIDRSGFVYCECHGKQRKASQPCRKLKPSELKAILSGQALRGY